MTARTRVLIGLAVVVALIALVVVSPFFLVRTGWFRSRALDRSGVSSLFAGEQRVRVERVRTFGPARVNLEGVRIERFHEGEWELWARLGRVEAAWGAADLLARRIHVSHLRVDSVRVDLDRMPAPVFASRKRTGADSTGLTVPRDPLKLPPIQCPSLRIEDVLLHGGERRLTGSVELSNLRHESGLVEGTMTRADLFALPESVSLHMEGGRLTGELVQAFRVDSLALRSDGLDAGLEASWKKIPIAEESPAGGSRLDGRISIDRWDPLALAPLRKADLPLRPGDAVRGGIVFGGDLRPGHPAQFQASIDLTGILFGHGLDSLLVQGIGSREEASLRSFHLDYESLRLDGTAEWRRAGSSGTARLVFRGLNLAEAPVALWAPDLPTSFLGGMVVVEADSLGPRVRLTASLRIDPGLLMDRPTTGFAAEAGLDPEELTIPLLQTLGTGVPALTASGRLGRRDRDLELSGDLHELSLLDWVTPWIGLPLQGRVSGPFRADGPLKSPRVEADLTVRQGEFLKVRADSLHVSGIRGSLVPLDLSGSLAARDLSIYEVPIDSLRAQIGIRDSIRTTLTAWRDSMRIRLGGRIRPAARGQVRIDSLSFQAGSAPELALAAPVRLDFGPEGVRTDSVRLRSDVGSLVASGRLGADPSRSGQERIALTVDGDDIRLGPIVDFFGGPSPDLYGTFGFHLEATGTLSAPSFALDLDGRGVMIYGWLWESLGLSARTSPGTVAQFASAHSDPGKANLARVPGTGGYAVQVDSLRGRSAGYFGVLPGQEQVGPEPEQRFFLLRGDSLSLRWSESWNDLLRLMGDSVALALDRAGLGGRLAMVDLPVAPVLAPALNAGASQVRSVAFQAVDPMLASIHEVRPAVPGESQRATGIGGWVSLEADLGGRGSDPRVDLRLRGRDLHLYQAWADSLVLDVGFADSLLEVRDLDWHMGRTRLHSTATWPVAATLGGTMTVLDRPVHAVTDLIDADLSLVSLVTRVIQDPRGRLSGRVEVGGTPRSLAATGDVRISDGAFRVPGREERFSRIEAHLLLDSAGVHIAEATGRLNETGRVTATGWLRNMKDFSLEAKVRNSPVYETGNYRFLVDADVTAQPVADGDSIRPLLSGEARVLEGLLTMDLAKPPSTGPPPRIPWLIELQILAPGNIHVNQPAANLDLGQGDIRASFRWPFWNLGGSIQVLDGTYRIFNRAVQVTSGTIEFEDTGSGPRPVLDIQAQIEIAQAEGEPLVIEISIKGRPPEPLDIALTSANTNTQYSEAQLIELLSVGQLASSEFGSFTAADPTRQYLSSELLNQVERQLVGQLPWADRVQLRGEFGGADPMWVNVRPIVEPQWSLNYAQELSASPGREVSLNYRLSNLFFVNAGVERKKNETNLPQDTYNLDLKFRIEY